MFVPAPEKVLSNINIDLILTFFFYQVHKKKKRRGGGGESVPKPELLISNFTQIEY